MTATAEQVAEKPVESKPVEPVYDFKPPRVEVGQEVFWYRHANKDNSPDICRVLKIEGAPLGRLLTLQSLNSRTAADRKYVKHITDPQLAEDPSWRAEWGAWDYTEKARRDSDRERRLAQLEDRVAVLEDLIGGKPKK